MTVTSTLVDQPVSPAHCRGANHRRVAAPTPAFAVVPEYFPNPTDPARIVWPHAWTRSDGVHVGYAIVRAGFDTWDVLTVLDLGVTRRYEPLVGGLTRAVAERTVLDFIAADTSAWSAAA